MVPTKKKGTATKRKPRTVVRKTKRISASRGSSNVILKLGSMGAPPGTLVTYGPPGSSSSAGGGGSSSSSTTNGGQPVASPIAAAVPPRPIGGGGGGGGGIPSPPPVDPRIFQQMIKDEMAELYKSLKKAHTARNREVLAQFDVLREQVKEASADLSQRNGDAVRGNATRVINAIRRSIGQVEASVGNTRDAIDALRAAQQGAQAVTEAMLVSQGEARKGDQETMLAALQQLKTELAPGPEIGNQLAVLEQAIVKREAHPTEKVMQALQTISSQIEQAAGYGVEENRAMFQAVSRYLGDSVFQITRNQDALAQNQRELAQGIVNRTDQLANLSMEGMGLLLQRADAQAALNADRFMQTRTALNDMMNAGNNISARIQHMPRETFDLFYSQLMPRQDTRQPHIHQPGIIPNAPPPPQQAALEQAYGGAALVPRATAPPQPSVLDAPIASDGGLMTVYNTDRSMVPVSAPDTGMVTYGDRSVAPGTGGLTAIYANQNQQGGAAVPQDNTPTDPYGSGAMVPRAARTLARVDDDSMTL